MNYNKKKISLAIWMIAAFILILTYANNNKKKDVNRSLVTTTKEVKNTNLTAKEQVELSDFVGKVMIKSIDKGIITSTLFNDKNDISEYAIDNYRGNDLSYYATDDPEGEVYVIKLTITDSLKDNIEIDKDFTLVIVQKLFTQYNKDLLQTDIEYLGSFQAQPGGYMMLTSFDKGFVPVASEDPYLDQIYEQIKK